MPTAVKFNGQLCVTALEIQDIPAHWMLTTKLEPTKTTATQYLPQQIFGISLGGP